MLTVVIDTTVLGADWLLQAPASTFVVMESTHGRLRLVVPELVLKEATNLYAREFRSTAKALEDAARKHRRMSLEEATSERTNLPFPSDHEQAATAYGVRLRELLQNAEAVICPLPQVPHAQLVARALAGDQPFDGRGHNGYRDALVWHNVLEVAQQYGRVAFVSGNASDFAATRNEPSVLAERLQQDLADLREAGFPNAEVILHANLSALVQTDFPPEEQAALELRVRLRRDRDFHKRVAEQLDGVWPNSWPEWEVDGDIDVEWEEQDLDMVGDVRDIQVDFTSAAEDDEVFVQLSAHADIQVAYTIRGSVAWFDNPPEILDQIEWDGRSDTGRYIDVVPATLTFEALYRPGAPELRDIKLTRIRESWDWVEEGRVLGGAVNG